MRPEKADAKLIFDEALSLTAPGEREAYLDRACGGDMALRQEVESLLSAYSQAGDFLSQTRQIPAADFVIERTGTMIGRYKLLEQIGEGGFGVVYMAEQVEPVQRKVALKIIKPGMDTRQVIARFEAERQALALMDHPNIAKVLDAGATEAGRPYFVMELVRGIPITDHCDEKSLSTAKRLELFIRVCQAVQHAHQKGIIHRDLKPSNVLVTLHDGQPVPKVIDFGVAKALGQKLTDKTLFTSFAQMLGTPAYMSPEQAELSGLDVDTRSDIYSLGVLLYELLTGVTPFDKETLAKAALDEIRRLIRESEPPKPSTRLQTLGDRLTEVAKRRQAEPATLSRLVRGDLDWIVMKALEKDRTRRYPTANELAGDIEHHLKHEPVSAIAPRFGYRLAKLVQRHRASVAVAGGFMLLLALTAVVSTSLAVYAHRQKARAEQAESVASDNLYAADIGLAKQALDNNRFAHARQLLRSYIPRDGQVDRRGVEWRHLWSRSRGQQLAVLPLPQKGTVNSLAITPGNSFLLEATSWGWLFVIRFEDFKIVRALQVFTNSECDKLALSLDGRRVAVSGGGNGAVYVWNLALDGNLSLLRRIQARSPYGLSFSPDGSKLAVGTDEDFWTDDLRQGGITKLFDVDTGEELASLPESGGRAVTFSPDGKWLATGPWRGRSLKLWDAAILKLERTIEMMTPTWLDFSSDSRGLLTGGIFDKAGYFLVTDQAPRVLISTSSAVNGGFVYGTLSPDGRSAATAVGNTVRLDDLQTQKTQELLGHDGAVRSLAFSRDGVFIVSGDTAGKVLLWSANRKYPTQARVRELHTAKLGYLPLPPSSPDGEKLALRVQGEIRILNGKTGRVWPTLPAAAFPLAFRDDDTLLAISHLDFIEANNRLKARWLVTNRPPSLEIWHLSTRTNTSIELTATGTKEISAVAISPQGEGLALAWRQGDGTNGVVLLETTTGEVRFSAGGFGQRINGLALSPSGRQLAVAMLNGDVQILEPPSAVPILKLRGDGDVTDCLVFSPDEKLLVAGRWSGVRVWSLPEGREFASRLSPVSGVHHVGFSASGETLIGYGDNATKLWHIPTGRDLLEMGYEEPRCLLPLAGERYVSLAYIHFNLPVLEEWNLWQLPPLEGAEAWLRAQPATLTEARQLLRSIPPRDARADARLVNLSSNYNAALWPNWHGDTDENDLAEFPAGSCRLDGVEFDARGIVQAPPAGAGAPAGTLTNIVVEQTCSRLHFLHAAIFADNVGEGTEIGRYIVHLEQGADAVIPLRAGIELADWWYTPGSLAPRVPAAWTGLNGRARQRPGCYVRLFHLAWKTPKPGVVVRSIDFVTTHERARPFLVGLTVESNGESAPPPPKQRSPETALNNNLASRKAARRAAMPPRPSPAVPARPQNATPEMVDLTRHFHAALTGQRPGDEGYDLADLASGVQTFQGVQFDVRGIVQLSSRVMTNTGGKAYRQRVQGIQIGRKCARLHFLHSTGWAVEDGTVIGSYILWYADGSSRTLPIVYGQDVRDWWVSAEQEPEMKNAQVAWRGQTSNGNQVRVYRRTWENPHPDRVVSSIEFISAMTDCAPFLLAITTE